MTERRRQNIEFMSGLEAPRKGMDVRSRSTPGVIDSDRSSFSLAELLAPWRQKLLWRRFSPEARLRNMRLAMVDWDRLSQTVPRLASRLVEHIGA